MISCVSRSEYEAIQKENESLRKEIDLLNQNIKTEVEKRVNYSEEEVLSQFKDYLEFYCSGCEFKDFKIRKSVGSSFDISMKKKVKNSDFPTNTWSGFVVRITFNSNGTFIVEDIDPGRSHSSACQ